MKTLLVLFIFLFVSSLTAQDFSTHNYYNNYHRYKESTLNTKLVQHEDIIPLINELKENNLFEIKEVGKSLLGKKINLIKIGSGPTTILAWSQMHGDESTATLALFDLFNFLQADDEFNELRKLLFEKLTIYFIPMLNPDGAKAETRRNAGMVDLNRDAARLQFPESKILKSVRDELNPQFGFNLHDQSTYYTSGNSPRSATISFLAPAFNYEKEMNDVRENTMKLIVDLNDELSEIIPGHIGRYNDDFEPRAFGDNFVKWGTSSILIESGGWKDDNEKQFIRKLNFIALLVGFESIAKGSYQENKIENYFAIPENERLLFDIIIRNLKVTIHNQEFLMDVAINRNQNFTEKGQPFFTGNVAELGDLSIFYGYDDYDFPNMKLESGKIYKDDNFENLSKDKIKELIKKGYTDFQSTSKFIDSIENFSDIKVNLFTDDKKIKNELKLYRNANFVIKENDKIKYLVINGLVINPDAEFN